MGWNWARMSDLGEISRKLVAVFAADVEGYSRLMGADEVGTLKGLTERRAILDRIIGEHRGRIANTAGDSVLAEFGSAVEAVQCAVEAQAELAEANASIAPDLRIQFRMGIHIGDVMVRDGDLFGDGVNIAARLQTLAKAGTVCISGATYDQVRRVLQMPFADLGLQQVKNIHEPVRVYEAGSNVGVGLPRPAGEAGVLPLPDRPSIAVLPFQNLSAYGVAAVCLTWRRANHWPADFASDDAELLSLADRVKELGTDDAVALSGIGMALFHNRVDFEAGIEMVDRAIRSNPNYAQAYNARGWFRVWDGGSDAAIADFEQAMRFSPRDPLSFTLMLGVARGHFNACRYAEAATWADRSIRSFPNFISGLAVAIACYVEAGRLDDAHRTQFELHLSFRLGRAGCILPRRGTRKGLYLLSYTFSAQVLMLPRLGNVLSAGGLRRPCFPDPY
jgi:class 3 adenylate cyclase